MNLFERIALFEQLLGIKNGKKKTSQLFEAPPQDVSPGHPEIDQALNAALQTFSKGLNLDAAQTVLDNLTQTLKGQNLNNYKDKLNKLLTLPAFTPYRESFLNSLKSPTNLKVDFVAPPAPESKSVKPSRTNRMLQLIQYSLEKYENQLEQLKNQPLIDPATGFKTPEGYQVEEIKKNIDQYILAPLTDMRNHWESNKVQPAPETSEVAEALLNKAVQLVA